MLRSTPWNAIALPKDSEYKSRLVFLSSGIVSSDVSFCCAIWFFTQFQSSLDLMFGCWRQADVQISASNCRQSGKAKVLNQRSYFARNCYLCRYLIRLNTTLQLSVVKILHIKSLPLSFLKVILGWVAKRLNHSPLWSSWTSWYRYISKTSKLCMCCLLILQCSKGTFVLKQKSNRLCNHSCSHTRNCILKVDLFKGIMQSTTQLCNYVNEGKPELQMGCFNDIGATGSVGIKKLLLP